MADSKTPVQMAAVTGAYETICRYLCEQCVDTPEERANLADSPARAAKALAEIVMPKAAIRAELTEMLSRVFPNNKSKRRLPMVVHGSVPLVSMCPHHLMLVEYDCYVAYLPKDGQILGISKLSRLSQMLARRPLMQEQLAEDIADVLYRGDDERGPEAFPAMDTYGSAAYLRGRHTCQSCRGVRSPAFTASTGTRGAFDDPSLEARFLTQIQMIEGRNSYGR